MKLSECFYLGYVCRETKTRDTFTIKLDVDDPSSYQKLESVLIQMHPSDEVPIPFFLKKTIRLDKNELSVQPETIHPIALKGKSVFLPLSKLPNLSGNKFYYHEIIGFEVVDENHGNIGVVVDTYDSAAHPIMAVEKNEQEILIPLTDDVLKRVDRKSKKIEVKTPEGLVDLYLS
jgi:16S rRNA processing protein RimM